MASHTNDQVSNNMLNLDDDSLLFDTRLNGDLGDDSLGLDLVATDGTNTLEGSDNDDYITLEDGTNTVDAKLGDDIIDIFAGTNTVDVGGGDDYIYISGGTNTITLGAGSDYIDSYGGFTEVTGGDGPDIFVLNSADYTGDTGATDTQEDVNYIQINDFTPGEDSLELWGMSFSDLTLEQDGTDTLISNGTDLLAVLKDIDATTLSEDDVIETDDSGWWGDWLDGENIVGDDDDNQLDGTEDGDWIEGLGGNDTLNGEGGNDELDGGAGDDTINGGDGDDYLWDAEGTNILNGGAGDDYIDTYGGNNTIAGGEGDDWIYTDSSDNDIDGGDGNDYITTYGGTNTIQGGTGDDYIGAYGGLSQVTGGAGADTFSLDFYDWSVWYGSSDDAANGADMDYMTITDFAVGEDSFELTGTIFDVLTLEQDGSDTKILDGDNLLAVVEGVSPDQLSADDFETYFWGDGEYLIGTDADETLTGTEKDDYLDGRAGDDVLNAGDGYDELYGGKGSDTLNGGNDADWLQGGADDDILNGDGGSDDLEGGAGNDILNGGAGDDWIWDDAGDNTIDGGEGNDYIDAYDGNNTINGGNGDDTISTGGGINQVTTGDGADIVTLDSGYWYGDDDDSTDETTDADTDYVVVTDFEPGNDSFELFDTTFEDLTLEQDGANTNIFDGDDLLAIAQNVNVSDLSADDFITYDWFGCPTGYLTDDILLFGDDLSSDVTAMSILDGMDSVGIGTGANDFDVTGVDPLIDTMDIAVDTIDLFVL